MLFENHVSQTQETRASLAAIPRVNVSCSSPDVPADTRGRLRGKRASLYR